MAEYKITNGIISATIVNKGAELLSLKDNKTDEEFLWDANPEYWNRTSPLLFPFIGGLKNKEYHYRGTTYPMEKHGFVRDAEFEMTNFEKDEVWFALRADDKTKEMYPFSFLLEVGYRLEGRKILVLWKVQNEDAEDMYFSIGGHPAIKCPRNEQEKRSDCFLIVNQKDKLENTLIGPDGLVAKEAETLRLENGRMAIGDTMFDKDALIIEDYQLHEIQFVDSNKQTYCTVSFTTPVVGIWSKAKCVAPFVCIEPWDGICDATDFTGQLEDRKWECLVKAGEIYQTNYAIEI